MKNILLTIQPITIQQINTMKNGYSYWIRLEKNLCVACVAAGRHGIPGRDSAFGALGIGCAVGAEFAVRAGDLGQMGRNIHGCLVELTCSIIGDYR